MRNLAKIGVLGHQLDVADGGDVDPGTGRLLSIAELQQALRVVRSGQHAADPTAAPFTPTPRSADVEQVERDDDFGQDGDPFGWDPDADGLDAVAEEPDRSRDSILARRAAARGASDQPTLSDAPTMRKRSALLRLTRKVLGLDRGPDPRAVPDGVDLAALPVGAPDPEVVASPRRQGREAQDFEVAAAPRGLAAVCWRWTARVLLLVLLVAGVNQLFVKPLHHAAAGPAVVAVIDPAVAGQIAARYAADYLSYSPGRAGANLPALTADSVPTAATSTQLFSGSGYVRTDLVQPGQLVTVDATHVLVTETVRIHLAIPPANRPAPPLPVSTPAAPPPGGAGDPGPPPTGWIDVGERWLTVTVPVESTPAGLRVSASGAVFTGEPPMVIAPIGGADPDSATTAATAAVAAAFFAGYAASDVSYLIPPSAPITGLGGAAAFVSLANWTVQTAAGAAPAAAATAGIGRAAVTWQLAGTTLQITQPYAVCLTFTSGRWYTAALGPATTVADQ